MKTQEVQQPSVPLATIRLNGVSITGLGGGIGQPSPLLLNAGEDVMLIPADGTGITPVANLRG